MTRECQSCGSRFCDGVQCYLTEYPACAWCGEDRPLDKHGMCSVCKDEGWLVAEPVERADGWWGIAA